MWWIVKKCSETIVYVLCPFPSAGVDLLCEEHEAHVSRQTWRQCKAGAVDRFCGRQMHHTGEASCAKPLMRGLVNVE